jgi:adenosylcobinamide-GDP ribazoletransferase
VSRPWWSGPHLAVTTFTVVPLPPAPADRAAARVAMACAPLVGALLGGVLGGLAVGLRAASAPALVTGGLVVAVGLLATRGLHVDGLADTADGLGSYRSRERALEIMRDPEVGPFGVAAVTLALLLQAAAVAGLAARPWTALLYGVATATAGGRLAVTYACRRGVPPARPDGLGALVAGTVGGPVLGAGTVAVLALALPAVPGRPWQGPLAVGAGLLGAGLLVRHATRRLGGITGDVLGAAVEVAATLTYVGLTLG